MTEKVNRARWRLLGSAAAILLLVLEPAGCKKKQPPAAVAAAQADAQTAAIAQNSAIPVSRHIADGTNVSVEGGSGFAHVTYASGVRTFEHAEIESTLLGISSDGHGFLFQNAGDNVKDLKAGDVFMVKGGMAITGFPPRGRHPVNLEATNPLVMWAYTDLSDSRWKFTKKYMMLRQDPKIADAQKLGLFNPNTWVAYVLNGEAFVKQARADAGSVYPDFGCSFETFTSDEFLEIEIGRAS